MLTRRRSTPESDKWGQLSLDLGVEHSYVLD